MPRNQSVGYIFMNGKESLADGRLVAHELGHGVYKLQHTFAYKQLAETKGKTDNLMDYNNGDFLAHYQWRVMQDSVMFVWGLFQDDEDGQKIYSPTFNDKYHDQKLDGKAFNKCLEYAKKIPFFNYCWNQLAKDNDIYKIDVVAVTLGNVDYVISQKSETNGWFSRAKDKEESCWFCWFSEPTKIPAGSEENPHTINFIGPSAKESTEKIESDGLVSSSTMVEEVFHAAHTSYYLKSGKDKKDKDWFDNGSQFIQTEIEIVIMKNLIYFMYYNNLISVDRKDYKEYEDYYKEYKKFHKDLEPYVQNYSILFNDGKYYSEKVHDKFKRLLTSDCTIKDVLWESNKPIDNFQKAISEKQGNEAYSSLDISKMDANMPFLNFLVSEYRKSLTKEDILKKINAAEEQRKKAAEEQRKKAAEEKKKNMSNSNKSKK
jgi:hypothetical protein